MRKNLQLITFIEEDSSKKKQDPKTEPNIYDTRQTFLKKIINQEMRQKFLESYNQRNP